MWPFKKKQPAPPPKPADDIAPPLSSKAVRDFAEGVTPKALPLDGLKDKFKPAAQHEPPAPKVSGSFDPSSPYFSGSPHGLDMLVEIRIQQWLHEKAADDRAERERAARKPPKR